VRIVGISYERGALNGRRNLLEHRKPLPGDGSLKILEPREIASGPRQAGNQTCTDRVRDGYEYYRDRTTCSLQLARDARSIREDHIGLQSKQIFRTCVNLLGSSHAKSRLDADIAALQPPEPFQLLPKSREPRLHCRVVLGDI